MWELPGIHSHRKAFFEKCYGLGHTQSFYLEMRNTEGFIRVLYEEASDEQLEYSEAWMSAEQDWR
ncbi:MAG: hypothetical protein IMY80_05410 [Chloroflexi bacterium]|nr:hypothetical protein [Chloroflexota bacterium]